MDLEWDFNTTETTGATVASRNKRDIQDELKNIVTAFFNDSEDYYKLDLVSKYQIIFDTTTYLFSKYRRDFELLIQDRFTETITEEQKQIEALVFCAWVSIEGMTALSSET